MSGLVIFGGRSFGSLFRLTRIPRTRITEHAQEHLQMKSNYLLCSPKEQQQQQQQTIIRDKN